MYMYIARISNMYSHRYMYSNTFKHASREIQAPNLHLQLCGLMELNEPKHNVWLKLHSS